MPDDFQRWTLPTRHLGKSVHIYERLDSTNTLALSLGTDPSRHGLVVMAREQSAGRGQYGREWHAPPGSSVLMSVLLFPPADLRRPALLTAWAAVSVCDTICKLTDLQANIKWPNDVLIRGKKVCGILIEQRTTGNFEFPLACVVGIGLNLTQTQEMFDAARLPDAGSLHGLTRQVHQFDDAAKALIKQLDALYESSITSDWHALQSNWISRLDLMGKRVSVNGIQQQYLGRVRELTLSRVDIETNDGEIVQLAPESIRQIHVIQDRNEPRP